MATVMRLPEHCLPFLQGDGGNENENEIEFMAVRKGERGRKERGHKETDLK